MRYSLQHASLVEGTESEQHMQGPEQELPEALTSGVLGLDEVLQPRRSRRATLLRLGATALALVIVLAVVLHVVAPASLALPLPFRGMSTTGNTSTTGKIATTVPYATPTTTQAVILQTNVNFGLSLNGNPVQFINPSGLIAVAKGKNTLAFNAPPFLPLSCSFVWPIDISQQSGDPNVPCASNGATGSNGNALIADVNFRIPMQNIPPALKASLQKLMREQLAQAITNLITDVPVGNYIPFLIDTQGIPQSRATTHPLHAQATAVIGSTNPWSTCEDAICPGSPLAPVYANAPTQHLFNFAIDPQLGWQFIDGEGQIESSVVLSGFTHQDRFPISVDVRFDATTNWQLVNPSSQQQSSFLFQQQIIDTFCLIAFDELRTILNKTNPTLGFGTSSNGSSVQGCTIKIQNGNGNGGTTAGTFISRFGALLAVDAGAHQLAPDLPIAPPAEVTAVGQG